MDEQNKRIPVNSEKNDPTGFPFIRWFGRLFVVVVVVDFPTHSAIPQKRWSQPWVFLWIVRKM